MWILCQKAVQFSSFCKDIQLKFPVNRNQTYSNNDVEEKAIYQLQTVQVNCQNFTDFYDSGCGDFVSR